MSAYYFVASDHELPEVDNIKQNIITVSEAISLGIKAHDLVPWASLNQDDEVIVIDNESDLDELVIRQVNRYDVDDIEWYTDKPFIYTVQFRYTDSRAEQLVKYTKENLREGYNLELWSIWLGDRQSVNPTKLNCKEISIYNIKQMYDCNYVYHSCIVIEK